MKNLILALILHTALYSCEESPGLIPDDLYWGEVTAIKNGEPWEGLIYAQPNQPFGYGFSVLVDVYNKQGFQREALTIFKIPDNCQRSEITNFEARTDTALTGAYYATLVDDGDVLGDSFDVFHGESENYVHITYYNASSGEVRGEFEVMFVFDTLDSRSDLTVPDTVRFTNGQFHTRIRDLE